MKKLVVMAAILFISSGLFADGFSDWFSNDGPCITLQSKEGHVLGWDIYRIALDRNGNIYFADIKERNVKKYSPSGNLATVFGREGSGPGEFLNPSRTAIVCSRLIILDDHRDDNVCTLEGKFLKTTNVFFGYSDIFSYMSTYLIATDYSQRQKYRATLFDCDLNKKRDFFDVKLVNDATNPVLSHTRLDHDSKGNLYISETGSYRIAKYDKDFNLIKVFGKPGKKFKQPPPEMPKFVSEKAAKRWIKQYTLLQNLFVVKDRYIVLCYQKDFDSMEHYFDIYSTDGEKLAEDLYFNLRLVGKDSNDNLYFYKTVERDDDVDQMLCKYKLKEHRR